MDGGDGRAAGGETNGDADQEEEYFDFNLRNYMEHNEGDPRMTQVNMEAGLEFDPDTQSLGSLRTTEYARRGENG